MVLFSPPSLRTKKLQIPSITEGSTGSQGAADADVAVSEPKKVAEFFPKSLTQAFDDVGRYAAKTRYCSVTGVRCCHPGTHNHPQCVEIKAVQI